MREIEARLRSGGGVLSRSSHRDLTGQLDRMLRNGQLARLLPGVYCAASDVGNVWVRLQGAALWAGPDAILTGRSAAKLTYWPSCKIDEVTLSASNQSKRSQPGFAVEFRRVPAWFTLPRGGVNVTSPALTAVDLAGGPDGGDAVDRVLRSGQATLAELWDTFRQQPHRRGNGQRAQILWDSRDEPWSEAERLQQRLLHQASITGWRSNRWVSVDDGGYWVDILFPLERLVVELDGWEFHGTREAFEADRRRRNRLVLAGYRVLNFTWRQLVEDPNWVLSCIRAGLGR